MIRRIGIYLTYDKQKIVDGYIGYMLKELKTCVDFLIVICNQSRVIAGMEYLTDYADEVFYRENIGFDAGGFKDALCRFIGWDKVRQYDELVLVNDSMFGPFRPMKEIFLEMNRKSVDFWGLTKHGEYNDKEGKYIDEHIQSFFLVIRSSLLHSHVFEKYWEDMPYYSTLQETIQKYEIRLTHFFSKLGYAYNCLANMEMNDSIHKEYNYSQYLMIPFEMIKKRNFPFLKKRPFSLESLNYHTQEGLHQAIDYIGKETAYDVNFIWDNIIRTLNMSDLQRSLHLQYIPENHTKIYDFSEQKCFVSKCIVIAVFIRYLEASEWVLEYLEKANARYEIRIFAESEEYLEPYKERNLKCWQMNESSTGEIFYDLGNYDLVCILHDTDMTSNVRSNLVGKSYFYNIWENLFKNLNHISGIIDTFEKEPRLGFLTSPQPNFEEYFGEYGKGWNGQFKNILRIMEENGISCPVSESKPPYRITSNFWIRSNILKKVKDIPSEDYSFLPYLWSYLAQSEGYYSGIVESPDYAAMNEVNLQYYLQQIASQIRKQYGEFSDFSDMKVRINSGAIMVFASKYRRIFVYGTGYMESIYHDLLPDIEAYIVSDGQMKKQELHGIPVKYLSEIAASDDCGVILCLNEENQKQVIPFLKRKGLQHYLCL